MSLKTDTKPKPTYHQDPLFTETMRQFQKGLWSDGLENLARLMNRFPGDKELTALNKEMTVRSRIDDYEKQEEQKRALIKIVKYVLISILVLALMIGAYWAIRQYSGYVQAQIDDMQRTAQENARQLELFARFRDAQNLLLADRPNDALLKFQEIQEVAPDYPNLGLYIDQATSMALVEDEYTRAVTLFDEFKYAEALEILNRINQTIPNYRDVSLRIEQLNQFSDLEVLLRSANTAFEQGNWEDALTASLELRRKDPAYQTAYVERLTYTSYLNAIQVILDNPQRDLESLRKADDYYSKALAIFTRDSETYDRVLALRKSLDQALFTIYVEDARLKLTSTSGSLLEMSAANALMRSALRLRPDDLEIQALYQTNEKYLQVTDEFVRGDWDLVIQNVASVLAEDDEYALGAALQTLFDALMARGRNSLIASDYKTALTDFEAAIKVTDQMPNNTLARLSADIEYARTLGLLNRTAEAVQVYQQSVDQAGLLFIARSRDQALAQLLDDAQTFASIGNDQTAYTTYRDVLDNLPGLLGTVSYNVQEGDYLPFLARQNGTTTELIMRVNSLLSRRIENGDVLNIPYLPGSTTP